MKKIIIALCVMTVLCCNCNTPGHGNWENKNLEETVIKHVSANLAKGEKAEFGGKYMCEDYKENDEVRFSATVIYYVVAKNGTKSKHEAKVITNEDKNEIIEWQNINANK